MLGKRQCNGRRCLLAARRHGLLVSWLRCCRQQELINVTRVASPVLCRASFSYRVCCSTEEIYDVRLHHYVDFSTSYCSDMPPGMYYISPTHHRNYLE